MKLHRTTLVATLVAAALLGAPVIAQSQTTHDVRHAGELAAMGLQDDPFAPVYIVTSRTLYDKGIHAIARTSASRRDSIGNALVLAEIQAHQLGDVSRQIHERENRCGGYFAFATRAEADAFIRSDRSLQAMRTRRSSPATPSTTRPRSIRGCRRSSKANIYNTINHLSGYRTATTPAPTARPRPSGSAQRGKAWPARAPTSPPSCSAAPTVRPSRR